MKKRIQDLTDAEKERIYNLIKIGYADESFMPWEVFEAGARLYIDEVFDDEKFSQITDDDVRADALKCRELFGDKKPSVIDYMIWSSKLVDNSGQIDVPDADIDINDDEKTIRTNKVLWSRLEKASKNRNQMKRAFEMVSLLKHGYEQDLDVLAFGSLRIIDGDKLFNQAYFGEPHGNNRLLICYTSWTRAKKEWRTIAEGGTLVSTELSIREMLNNLFNKKSIAGIIFNPDDANKVIIPKELLEMMMPGEKPLPEHFSET